MTRLLACAFIAFSYFEIRNALPRLAERAPGGIALAGVSLSLWISFSVEVFVCGTILLAPLIARVMPEAVHFGWRRLSDYSPRQLERVLPVVTSMSGAMAIATAFFLGYGIHMRIQAALKDFHKFPPVLVVYAALLISFILITYYYGQRMDEEAGAE